MMTIDNAAKPVDWPQNAREWILDCILEKLDAFEENPSYITRESLLALVSNDDLNQFSSHGLLRFTEYEVGLINAIYLMASYHQINSVKAFLYDLITEATRLQKINSWSSQIIDEKNSNNAYRILPYENGLLFCLKLYHYSYQKFTLEKNASFVKQLLSLVSEIFDASQSVDEIAAITRAYVSLLNDISYMRGNKMEKLWEFDRDELFLLFEMEAKLLKANKENPIQPPTRGVLMTQISNYILKSRNDYNQDYICKYLPKNVAKTSARNHEIWMKKTESLNDEREQKVIPELFSADDWVNYSWAKDIDFTPTRLYYVSSFSKAIGARNMQSEYGECLYGYKNDRIAELVGPIMKAVLKKKTDAAKDLPDERTFSMISQVIAFDVLYDKGEAREELKYLFKVIDLFDMTDNEKHMFLEAILQYWILTVKDEKWKDERERRYVLFLYDEYEYIETVTEEPYLKEKTSLFLFPDFIIGDNPARKTIQRYMEMKQKGTMSRTYLHCKDCLIQDYDAIIERFGSVKQCPVCGSVNIEIIDS